MGLVSVWKIAERFTPDGRDGRFANAGKRVHNGARGLTDEQNRAGGVM